MTVALKVVDVRGLVATVGSRRIVADVSFSLAEGQIVALVGESGSGKTTTGLALLGERPIGATVSGQVEVEGARVDAQHRPPAGTVGYIPQHPSAALNPVRRVGPVLRELARRHVHAGSRTERKRLVHERVLEALRRAHLSDGAKLLGRYPHQLSGGQQQRVVLAHALLGQPRVLVADEPTTGQDVVIRSQIIEELRAVSARGIAILLLTHDLDLVRALAHHVMVMRDGTIVESGPTDGVLGSPQHAYTRQLVDWRRESTPHEARIEPGGTEPDGDEPVVPVVSVRGLVAGHRGRRGWTDTVRHVSVDIHSGDKVAVVGRSGSGKTTLARCVAGLHPCRGGEILLDTTPLAPRLRHRRPGQLARIQYVFQDARASFNEFVPVIHQVARTAERLRGVEREVARGQAIEELARLGVPSTVAARLPKSLSGGELQRAALVRAMLSQPDLLVCDEITSGLDTVTTAELLQVLDKVQQNTGCALVIITHDLAVAAGLADRVLVMHEGRIVERGRTAEVLASPRHPATRALVAAASAIGPP